MAKELMDLGEAAMLLEAGAKVIAKQIDEIEQLETEVARLREYERTHPYCEADMDMHVQAVTEELRAEIDRLRAALQPFDRLATLKTEGQAYSNDPEDQPFIDEINRLRTALEFYTDGYLSSKIDNDGGEVARRALEGKEGK